MIKTYSNKKDGNVKLSANFRVGEFVCKDGSDTILIDTALVDYLQRIRNWAGSSVVISSGYRTVSHNAKIGGATNSQHTKGCAADIIISSKNISKVAAYAEAIGIKGVEKNEDSNYVHIDTRATKYLWTHKGGKDITVSTHGGKCPYTTPSRSLKKGHSGNDVRWLQFWLNLWGFSLAVDGSFGAKTDAAVRDVQKRRELVVDGIAGTKTRLALKGF